MELNHSRSGDEATLETQLARSPMLHRSATAGIGPNRETTLWVPWTQHSDDGVNRTQNVEAMSWVLLLFECLDEL